MNLIEAQQKLKNLNIPILQTSDVAACLKISIAHASKILERLQKAKSIIKLTRGKWLFKPIDQFLLPEYLTDPFPSYISLQSALFYHEMISQIPNIIYAVTIDRTKKIKTPLGTVSLHHVKPSFFFGFDYIPKTNIKIACPEKALLDICYLSPAKSLLFKSIPELELPKGFSRKKIKELVNKVDSPRRKVIILKKIDEFLER